MDINTAKNLLDFALVEMGSTGVKSPTATTKETPKTKTQEPLPVGRAAQQQKSAADAAKRKSDAENKALQPDPNAKLNKRDQAIANDVAQRTQERMLKKQAEEKAKKDEAWRQEQIAKREEVSKSITKNATGKGLPTTSQKDAAPKTSPKTAAPSPQIFGGNGPLRSFGNPAINQGGGALKNPGPAKTWVDKAMDFGSDAYKSFKTGAKKVANSQEVAALTQKVKDAKAKIAAKAEDVGRVITKATHPTPAIRPLPPVQPQRVMAPVQAPVMAAPIPPAPRPVVQPIVQQPVVQPMAQPQVNRVRQAQQRMGVGINRQGSALGPRR